MRPYTGIREGFGRGRRAGTEAFAAAIQRVTVGRLWNNGTYAMRPIRGGSTPSVHATGRAVDLSFRKTAKHQGSDRAFAEQVMAKLIEHADELGIEMVIDYSWTKGLGGGRVWKCDRNAWKDAKKGLISGGGSSSSDWIHVELSPSAADDPQLGDKIASILAQTPPPPPAPSEPPKYPGRPLKFGSTGKAVEAIQTRLGIIVDGKFAGQTDRAVREFQERNALVVDGIVGVNTWGKLFGSWQ